MTTGLDDLEPEPAAAAAVFGDRLEIARAFARDLARSGEELGLIGPQEPPRLWTRHLVNSGLVAPLLRPGARVGDIGSGAGLPGLVLALARPDVRLVLIEPMERRCEWLRAEAERLGLQNVEVVRARAEECGLEGALDQVTARAVASLSKLIPLAAPLLRPGGELVLMKGARVHDELEAARRVLRRFHVRDPEILVLGEGLSTEATRVFRATVDRSGPG